MDPNDTAQPTVTDAQAQPVRRSGSVLPGIALLAVLLGGIGLVAYQSWREANPLPRVPDDVEPMLKQPGVVPKPLQRAS